MSGGTLFLLMAGLVLLVAGAAFYYGFKLGLRAERSNWDLRYMVTGKSQVLDEQSISELEVAINEQLGFWIGEPNDVDTAFCENLMASLDHLRPHVEALRRKSKSQWEAARPVWERLAFKKVTMATCIEYELTRQKVIDLLKELLGAVGRKPARKLAL